MSTIKFIKQNEPVLKYLKGSKERKMVVEFYNEMFNSKIDIPLYIGRKILTDERKLILPPHDHRNLLEHILKQGKSCETCD